MIGGELATVFSLPRAHTAIAEWLFVLLVILPQKKRFGKWGTMGISVGCFVLLMVLNRVGEKQPSFWWMVFMLLCMGGMVLYIYASCKISIKRALYYWSQAFLTAEFAASLEWQLTWYVLHALQLNDFMAGVLVSYFILLVIYSVIFALMWVVMRQKEVARNRFHLTWRETASALLITIGAFAIGNFSFAFRDNAFTESLSVGVLYVRTLVDFAGIIMLMAHEAQRQEMNMAYELQATNSLMLRQYEQYQQYRENDESLHRLYHDLKHQIAFIRQEHDSQRREDHLSEMDEVIRRHEAATETGNSLLDTILTGKNLSCMQKGIAMTCFADGRGLAFMDVMDVCTIFGNALDNAIEYEEKIEEPGKRLIKVNVFEQQPFIAIRIENYCEEQILTEGETPRTSKKDRKNHGYGLKSIRRAVGKYGGHVKLTQEDCWFIMTILIPTNQES